MKAIVCTKPSPAVVLQFRDEQKPMPRENEVLVRVHAATVVIGPVVDQSAIHGILKKIRDMGMPLLAVNQIEPKYVEMKISTDSVKKNRSKRRKK